MVRKNVEFICSEVVFVDKERVGEIGCRMKVKTFFLENNTS